MWGDRLGGSWWDRQAVKEFNQGEQSRQKFIEGTARELQAGQQRRDSAMRQWGWRTVVNRGGMGTCGIFFFGYLDILRWLALRACLYSAPRGGHGPFYLTRDSIAQAYFPKGGPLQVGGKV